MFWKSNRELEFPQRKNNSLEDNVKREKNIGVDAVNWNWDDIFEELCLDSQFYTAIKGRAIILAYLSSQSVPNPKTIEAMINYRRPWLLHMATFTKGPYPILRCNLAIPDNLRDPLYLEAQVDVRDGNMQDFCQAVLADEKIDIILKGECFPSDDGYYALAFQAPKIANLLKRELQNVLHHLKSDATGTDFAVSCKILEATFSSSSAGIDLANAQNLFLRVRLKMI